MLIRIRSKEGNFRFDFSPQDDISKLLEKILETSKDAEVSTIAISNQPRGNEMKISDLKSQTLGKFGLSHGDIIFVSYKSRAEGSLLTDANPSSVISPAPNVKDTAKRPWESVQEDQVDAYWRSHSGMIPRERDSRFCKHAINGMCDYCMPLEPYDVNYHKEHSIKHLSYYAYLRKISPKPSASAASQLPPLNPLAYKVKSPCPTGTHPTWPDGICTSCQPSSITLQSQPFRMVDHLEIASESIIDRFLQAWRKTGLQRFGWLIGRYEPYEKVPMGVKAVVEAIYEPPQQGELDGLTLGWPWEDEARIRELSGCASTPLKVVGYIFTDLDPTVEDRTKNVYKRHAQSFYLSSLEAIFAATLQKTNPTASKSSPTGQFSSRLLTAVLTATADGQVDVAAYQVSEQAVAMVEADMIEASLDPGIVRVKEEDRTTDSGRYVPDVFFSYRNEYGLEVKKSAKPCFPVEYLLVNVTHGFPQNPSPVFHSVGFAIENRPGLEDQNLENAMSTLRNLEAPSLYPGSESYKKLELAKWLSDFHLISFLETTHLLSPDNIKTMMRTVSSPTLLEDARNIDPILETEGWNTLMTFTRESAPAPTPTTSAPPISSSTDMLSDEDDYELPAELYEQIRAENFGAVGDGEDMGGHADLRVCPHCTFQNDHGGSDCEVCGLPL